MAELVCWTIEPLLDIICTLNYNQRIIVVPKMVERCLLYVFIELKITCQIKSNPLCHIKYDVHITLKHFASFYLPCNVMNICQSCRNSFLIWDKNSVIPSLAKVLCQTHALQIRHKLTVCLTKCFASTIRKNRWKGSSKNTILQAGHIHI